jgi:hypothetical protein
MENNMTRSPSRTIAGLAAAVLVFSTAGAGAEQAKPAADAGSVNVTVKYTGAGTVDDNRRIWVWLFDNPNIGQDSIPIGEQSIAKNGGTASFTTTSAQVYIAIAYDEKGGFMGQAPPPTGSPIAMYGMTGPDTPPQPVAPGAKGKVNMTFDDSQRMP